MGGLRGGGGSDLMGATSLCQKSSFDYDKICSGTKSLSIKTRQPEYSYSDNYGVSSGKFYQSETSHRPWEQREDEYQSQTSHRARGKRENVSQREFSSGGQQDQEFEFDFSRKYTLNYIIIKTIILYYVQFREEKKTP